MKPNYSNTKLKNGINVVTYNMPHVRSVGINVIVKVGSRFENLSEWGISHFLEHMAFKGTENRSAKDIAEAFDNIGGAFNAYTSREQTVYHTKVLAENTELALEILADILQNSLYREEDVEKEKAVINQEIAQTNDNPDDLAFELLGPVAFGDTPVGRSILGTKESIAKFTPQNLKDYVAKHYNAENIYISAAGCVDHDIFIKLAERLFSAPSHSAQNCEQAKYYGGCNLLEKDLEQTTFILGFEGYAYSNLKEYYTAQMLSLILGGGNSSRLFQQVRESRGLAYAVGAFMTSYNDTGLFSIYAGTDSSSLQELQSVLLQEVDKIKHDVTDIELQRAEAQMKANIWMAQEKTGYKAEEIGKNYSIFSRFVTPNEVISILNDITKDNIIKTANKIFTTTPSVTAVGNDLSGIDYSKIKEHL